MRICEGLTAHGSRLAGRSAVGEGGSGWGEGDSGSLLQTFTPYWHTGAPRDSATVDEGSRLARDLEGLAVGSGRRGEDKGLWGGNQGLPSSDVYPLWAYGLPGMGWTGGAREGARGSDARAAALV